MKKDSSKKVLHVGAAVIRRDCRVLLSTRPVEKPPAGLEFPGGKIEPGESLNLAIKRELREELGVEVLPLDEIFRISHETENAIIHLRFVRVVLPQDAIVTPLEGQNFGWFDLHEHMPEELLKPDRPVWDFLHESPNICENIFRN
ncbi:MAG: NUDIX domain-containing protein [Victivallales bacterium]|jgi:mutator protein MutT|nr:NUDIX domain-containing protein [Victivallales bacterium]